MRLLYCMQVCVLLTALMQKRARGQGCPVGWFGAGCRLQCHCAHSDSCGEHGECPNNEPCRSPYFGPACQYVDYVITHGATYVPRYISDYDDSTCNPDANATSVLVNFGTSVYIYWFRIGAKNNITLFHRNFTTTIGAVVHNNVQLFKADNNVMDVTLLPGMYTTSLKIEGPVAPHICTIHVGGGRNVALKETVSQTSNYGGPRRFFQVENAVDGDTNPEFLSGSCTHSGREDSGPELHLTYHRLMILYTVRVYNRNLFKFRLRGFNLATYSQERAMTNNLTAPNQDLPVFEFTLPSQYPVTFLRIKGPTNIPASHKWLSVCEVETYGDTMCAFHTHGVECEYACNCSNSELCNQMTGRCEFTPVYYCPPGTYGDLCEFPCPENCQYSVCEAHVGGCLQCIPGYLGQFCDQVCPPGTFGVNCSLKCSKNCAGACHHITAVCSCVQRFTGALCTECAAGWYGDNCTHKCSDLCYMNRCDALTGQCETCIDKHKGFFCEECSAGWYGDSCKHKCSNLCYMSRCDAHTGVCGTCIDKHTGSFCEECDSGWFGDDCTKTCPKTCPRVMCDNITGECMSCVGNRIGPMCEECPHGYYGALCDIPCSAYCSNRSCDVVDGACHACVDGHRGAYCNLECPEGYYGSLCDIPCSAYCRNRSCDQVSGACHTCTDGYRGAYCNLEQEDTNPPVWLLPLLIPGFLLFLFWVMVVGGESRSEEYGHE